MDGSPFAYEDPKIQASTVSSAGPHCQGPNSVPAVYAGHATQSGAAPQSLNTKRD